MAYRLFWLVENRVLIGEWWGSIDLAQLTTYYHEVIALAAPVPQPIHLIIISTRIQENKLRLQDLQALALQFRRQGNVAWRIFVNERRLDRMIASLASQFFMGHARQFATLPEALTFLQEMDDTLPDLVPLMDEKDAKP